MSRYFFDVIDDNVRVADAHGFEFSSIEAARSEASRSSGDRAGPTGYKRPCIPGARQSPTPDRIRRDRRRKMARLEYRCEAPK